MLRFSREYTKLKQPIFTTIRKNTGHYKEGYTYRVKTPTESYTARCIGSTPIKKVDITESLARFDADCFRYELISMLEGWYGLDFNDLVLLTFWREFCLI